MKNTATFMTYDKTHGQIRVFVEYKECEISWGTQEEANQKAQELNCEIIEENIASRVQEWKRRTEPYIKRVKLQEEAYIGSHGEFRWKSNKRCVPLDYFRDAEMEAPSQQKELIDEEDKKFIEEYIKQNKNRKRSPEELYELRAAFEPGTVVVDIFTGDKTII